MNGVGFHLIPPAGIDTARQKRDPARMSTTTNLESLRFDRTTFGTESDFAVIGDGDLRHLAPRRTSP
jgi:hypothetical protein